MQLKNYRQIRFYWPFDWFEITASGSLLVESKKSQFDDFKNDNNAWT